MTLLVPPGPTFMSRGRSRTRGVARSSRSAGGTERHCRRARSNSASVFGAVEKLWVDDDGQITECEAPPKKCFWPGRTCAVLGPLLVRRLTSPVKKMSGSTSRPKNTSRSDDFRGAPPAERWTRSSISVGCRGRWLGSSTTNLRALYRAEPPCARQWPPAQEEECWCGRPEGRSQHRGRACADPTWKGAAALSERPRRADSISRNQNRGIIFLFSVPRRTLPVGRAHHALDACHYARGSSRRRGRRLIDAWLSARCAQRPQRIAVRPAKARLWTP